MNTKFDVEMANEKEWRRYLTAKIEKVEENTNNLKIKVAAISGSISLVIAIAYKKLGL